MNKFLILLTLILAATNLFAYEKTFSTITEAVNYTGEDKNIITKITITGTIKGNDYSEGSEWRLFRTLDETFPNIEEVEILTSQNIPNGDYTNGCLFNKHTYGPTYDLELKWLRTFIAKNIKRIGSYAFRTCQNLDSIYLPSVETIEFEAFAFSGITSICLENVREIGACVFEYCKNLISVYLPVLTNMYHILDADGNLSITPSYATFGMCPSLRFVSIGTKLTKPTKIKIGDQIFGSNNYYTKQIDLVLGVNVSSPVPNLISNTWLTICPSLSKEIYIWKSITIDSTVDVAEKEDSTYIYQINNKVFYIKNISLFELYDIFGKQINTYNNIEILDLNFLSSGIYFIRYSDGN